MPSSTGYQWAPNGAVLAESGLPTAGPAAESTLWAYARYNFAVNGGGAPGPISLLGAARIPAKALIIGGCARVITPLTGASATAALSVEGANDLIAAAAVSGAPWSTTGTKALIPLFGTPSTWVLTTVARDLVLTSAVAALTAGVVDFYVAYIPVLA